MAENQTAVQEFVESLADLVPSQTIIVANEKGVAFAKGREYSDAVKAKEPIHVRIANFGSFKGSPEEILDAVKTRAAARAALAE